MTKISEMLISLGPTCEMAVESWKRIYKDFGLEYSYWEPDIEDKVVVIYMEYMSSSPCGEEGTSFSIPFSIFDFEDDWAIEEYLLGYKMAQDMKREERRKHQAKLRAEQKIQEEDDRYKYFLELREEFGDIDE